MKVLVDIPEYNLDMYLNHNKSLKNFEIIGTEKDIFLDSLFSIDSIQDYIDGMKKEDRKAFGVDDKTLHDPVFLESVLRFLVCNFQIQYSIDKNLIHNAVGVVSHHIKIENENKKNNKSFSR